MFRCSFCFCSRVHIFLVQNLVRSRDNDEQEVLSLRDRCDSVRRRTLRNDDSVATPILYRSQLFAPLSPESPCVLVDILRPTDDMESDEWNAHFTFYNMTYRCDLESRWLTHLKNLLGATDSVSDGESALVSPDQNTIEADPSLFKVGVPTCYIAWCNIGQLNPYPLPLALFVDRFFFH